MVCFRLVVSHGHFADIENKDAVPDARGLARRGQLERNESAIVTLISKSSSMASPRVFDKKRILFPSCDQSARSPNHVTRLMCGGRWSAGLSPALGSAAERPETAPSARQAART
jgi:hypothetical protein